MTHVLLDSQGFNIGRWYFPSFTLRSADCVTIRFPKEVWIDSDRIIACLAGIESVSGLKLHTTALFAKPASSPSGWRRWFQDPIPFAWLKKNTTLSGDAIRSFLIEHKMDRDIPLSRYAGTPRMLLGLKAAYARSPEVIVFSTAGLDPMGVRETCRFVADKLPSCSAIYLASSVSCQGQEHDDFFPGCSSVTVIDKHQPVLAE